MIKNVIFDIGAVLIRFDWKSYVNRLFDEKTAQEVTRATWENPTWGELDRAVIPFEEVLKQFIDTAPEYEQQIRQVMEHLGECTERTDYAIPWVEELKDKGYKVFFLSNYFEYLRNQSPEVLDFIPHMDGGVFSYQIHKVKPHAEIFDYICQRYDLRPEESLFIDDSQKNVDGARAFGMHALLFTTYEQSYPEIMAYLTK